MKKILLVISALIIAGCGKMPIFDGKDVYSKTEKTCLDTTTDVNACKEQ